MNYVVFDIETYSPSKKDVIDTDEFRVSVTGAYISWINEYVAFLEDETKDFIEVMKNADLIIGYNHLWFDFPVLQKYADFNLKSLPSYDIMLEIEKKVGYKMKLNDVCKANLGVIKTDDYEQYKNYYWDKNWFPLIDYCMHDVKLTNDIFDQILNTGVIKYNDLHETKEVELDQPTGEKKDSTGEMESIF